MKTPAPLSKHDVTWERNYALLKRIADETGNANVRISLVVDDVRIGAWATQQRWRYKQGKLSQEQIAKLEAIGVAWDPLEAAWEERYALLKRIADETGNANVHYALVVDGVNIGSWSGHQRFFYSQGTLSADRILRLETIGFSWCLRASTWEARYALLKRIALETGNANVPDGRIVDGVNIGQWVATQRRNYASGKLSAERILRLEAIGLAWDDRFEAVWESHYTLLSRIIRETGSGHVRADLVVDGVRIGTWARRQRGFRRKGRLSRERIAKLEAIGFKWDPPPPDGGKGTKRRSRPWERDYAILEAIWRETGSTRVHHDLVVDGRKIGWWVQRQRVRYREGTLRPEYAARLEAIGFAWDGHAAAWEAKYSLLDRIIRETGSGHVRADLVVDGVRIGEWAGSQRCARKQGRLSRERIAKLDAIGFEWHVDRTTGATWEDNCALLERIALETGNANVPDGLVVDGVRIGEWARRQRRLYSQYRLPREHIVKLEAIGFQWTTSNEPTRLQSGEAF